VLEMAEEDAAALRNIRTDLAAPDEFRAIVGYDVYQQLREVILAAWPEHA